MGQVRSYATAVDLPVPEARVGDGAAARAEDSRTLADPATGLALRGVSKTWRTRSGGKVVLRDLDLELAAGTVTWIGGKNGTGKTTLLRVVSGLIAADRGTVTFKGLSPDRDQRAYQRLTGFLSAGDRGLYARLSVRHHLEYEARLAFLPRRERRATLAGLADRCGLGELLERRVDRLSLGQRQRVKVAMAIMRRPELLLLDEPISSLDEDGVAVVRDAVSDASARGGVVVWCSPPTERHAIDCDRELVLVDGALESA